MDAVLRLRSERAANGRPLVRMRLAAGRQASVVVVAVVVIVIVVIVVVVTATVL
jgi:hypothetical protein